MGGWGNQESLSDYTVLNEQTDNSNKRGHREKMSIKLFKGVNMTTNYI